MPFEMSSRRETWCFLEVRRGKTKYYQRLPFNFVEYDGDPNRYMETVPISDFLHIDSHNVYIQHPDLTGVGRIAGFEIFPVYPFEGLHRF